MTTAGQWPWKPASAKKCVIAYQPNETALKMDVTKTKYTYTFLSFNHEVPEREGGRALSRALASLSFLMAKQVGRITEVGLKLVVIRWWTGPVSRSWW